MAGRRWTNKSSEITPIFVQELVVMAKQVDSQSIGMMGFGVHGLAHITDTVNNTVLCANSIGQLNSKRMQEIMAAYYQATLQGEKAARNLHNAITMSLSELGILRTAIDHMTMSSNDTTWIPWFNHAHVKEALRELDRVDPSKLVLPTSLLTDFNDAAEAYDMVAELCKKGRKRSFRKQAAAMTVQVACIASVIVLTSVKVGLGALEVAAGVLTSGMSVNIGGAGAGTTVYNVLKELIDTLNAKIGAFGTEREVLKQAEIEAGNLHVDMKKIKLRLEALQGEMLCLSSHVGVAQRLHSLSLLMEAQVHAELLNHYDNLIQLKASCADLIRSTLNAFDTFKKQRLSLSI